MHQIFIAVDEADTLSLVGDPAPTLIECHAEAAAALQLHGDDSVFQMAITPLMQGPIGEKPAHTWTGTALAFERPDGSFDAPVDLKGEPGEGLENYTGDPLTFFILAAS